MKRGRVNLAVGVGCLAVVIAWLTGRSLIGQIIFWPSRLAAELLVLRLGVPEVIGTVLALGTGVVLWSALMYAVLGMVAFVVSHRRLA